MSNFPGFAGICSEYVAKRHYLQRRNGAKTALTCRPTVERIHSEAEQEEAPPVSPQRGAMSRMSIGFCWYLLIYLLVLVDQRKLRPNLSISSSLPSNLVRSRMPCKPKRPSITWDVSNPIPLWPSASHRDCKRPLLPATSTPSACDARRFHSSKGAARASFLPGRRCAALRTKSAFPGHGLVY